MKLVADSGGGGGYRYAGPYEKKLIQAFYADDDAISTAATEWYSTGFDLSVRADEIERHATTLETDAFGPNQDIAAAAATRYRAVATSARTRGEQMQQVSNALWKTKYALATAQTRYANLPPMAQDPTMMPGYDTPMIGPVVTKIQHDTAVANREAAAKKGVLEMESSLRESRDDIRAAAGDAPPDRNGPGDTSSYNPTYLPDSVPPGPGGPGPTPGPGGGGGGGTGGPGPIFEGGPEQVPGPGTGGPDPEWPPRIPEGPPEGPPTDPHGPELPDPEDPDDDGSFEGPVIGDPGPTPAPTPSPTPGPGGGGGIGGGVAGTVGAGVVSGAGAIAASRPSAGGMRGIVSGSNTTLGRSATSARGGAIGGSRGMVPGGGGRAGGTTAGGARGAGGSRGMVPGGGGRGAGAGGRGAGGRGMAPGSGGRGAAGGRGTAGGRGAGRGMAAGTGGTRGNKDRDQQGQDHFEYDDPDSWLDDDGTTDAVID